jgi:hypothetical protein
MQQFDINVPAVGGFPVHAPGRYIKYLSGNNGGGDVSLIVTPGGQGGSKIVLQVGQAYRVADAKPTPDSWTLASNAGGAAITGKVVIGDGRIDDNTLQGVVQVVDGGKARTLSGAAFMGFGLQPVIASVYSRIQLWNPATNQNRLVVEQISANCASTASIGVGIVQATAALGTVAQVGQNKKMGGAASVAQLTNDTAATPSPVPLIGNITLEAIQKQNWFVPHEPLIVPPGYGITLWANTAAQALAGTFEWYEEPNV